MDFKDAIDSMVINMKELMSKMIAQADYDKTYTGVVRAVQPPRTGSNVSTYTVLVNGVEKTIKSELTLAVDDYALVLVPRNDWNSARFSYMGGGSSDGVARFG